MGSRDFANIIHLFWVASQRQPRCTQSSFRTTNLRCLQESFARPSSKIALIACARAKNSSTLYDFCSRLHDLWRWCSTFRLDGLATWTSLPLLLQSRTHKSTIRLIARRGSKWNAEAPPRALLWGHQAGSISVLMVPSITVTYIDRFPSDCFVNVCSDEHFLSSLCVLSGFVIHRWHHQPSHFSFISVCFGRI